MGLDLNSVKFLLWSKNLGVSFDRTLTLGRQGMSCARGALRRELKNFGIPFDENDVNRCFEKTPSTPAFAENFLKFLGAKKIVTVDRSDFEGATLLHDLNDRFPEDLRGTFDLVIDGGTLEHIFDYPRALSNCLELLRAEGHFVTLTPASGAMGHGFYQFSPELFFRVFSQERGYALKKIVLYECAKTNSDFFDVQDPARSGGRSVSPLQPMQLAVLAQKLIEPVSVSGPPQQSDYVEAWAQAENEKTEARSTKELPVSKLLQWRYALNPYWPSWLRDLRDELRSRWGWYRGLRNMKRLSGFTRLRARDIYEERSPR